MRPIKPESFARGAMLLSLAGLATRLLGVFYKPVITRIFEPFDGHGGAMGSGLIQVPLSAYMVILSFTSVGLNVGISRLVAERMALEDQRGARRVFTVSLTLMAVLGLAAGLVMWTGASWISGLISENLVETVPGFKATALALPIVSVAAAYRGLFQGMQYMSPNASSQMIEQAVRVGTGILLTFLLVRQSVPLGAAGFNLGDVAGGLAALLFLLSQFRRLVPGWGEQPPESSAPVEPLESLMRRILAVAGPITVVGAVVPLMMLADTFFVLRNLPNLGIVGNDATAQYGVLSNVFMIVYLPTVFTSAIYTSILPAITEAVTLKREGQARERASQALRMTSLIALPAQVGLYVLAQGLYGLIYPDTYGGPVLAALSWATVPILLQQTSSGILQGAGRIGLPVGNFVWGALLKIALTALWTPAFGIKGAAYATAVGFGLAAILNLIGVQRTLGRTLQVSAMLLKPLGASLSMGAALLLLRLLWAPGRVNGGSATLVLILIGVVAYLLFSLLFGAVRREDLESVPRVGSRIATLLERLRLLR